MTVVVLFRVDSGSTIGTGHLMRCCALAVALNKLERTVCYFESTVLDLAKTILAPFGLQPKQIAPDIRGDVFVVDVGSPDAALVREARQVGCVVVSIEDCPNAVISADMIIRPNTLAYVPPKGRGVYLGGREFIMLQPIYADRNAAPIIESVQRVIICFGGGDPANLSRRFAKLLRQLDRRAMFRLAIGPHYQWKAELTKVCATQPEITVIEGVISLADEMANCDLAIISGGTLAYEACAMGRPAIVISQNADQAREAVVMANAGAILDVGRHDCVSDCDIVRAVRWLWDDHRRRLEQSLAGAAFIPRDGAQRVAAAILERLQGVPMKSFPDPRASVR